MLGTFAGYKGFAGTVEFDKDDGIYYGKLINTDDIVGYHSRDIVELYDKFVLAVDNYIEFKELIERR